MNPNSDVSRRGFLKSSAVVSGSITAFGSVGGESVCNGSESFGSSHSKELLSKAFEGGNWESTITLFLPGGFSHLDAWCYRPELIHRAGEQVHSCGKVQTILKPTSNFRNSKVSEIRMSEWLPELAGQTDKMTFLHGVSSNCGHHGIAAKDWSALTDRATHSLALGKCRKTEELLSSQNWFGKGDQRTERVASQMEHAVRSLSAGTKHQTVRVVGPGLDGWDAHRDLTENCRYGFQMIDRPFAGLIRFLAASGKLEKTLLLCISEFGRSPFLEDASGEGRGHQNEAFSIWFAGGKTEGGRQLGEVDSIGMAKQGKQIPAKEIAELVANG